MPKRKNGDEVGSWTIIDIRPVRSLCRCVCGAEQLVLNCNLFRGSTSSCRDCKDKARIGSKTRRVGRELSNETYRRLWIITQNAIRRCTNRDSAQWKDYGGRGITVHPPWVKDWREFLQYLATLPGHDDPKLVIDREDNNGPYEPGNLRFVTRSVSSSNRRPYGHLLRKTHLAGS